MIGGSSGQTKPDHFDRSLKVSLLVACYNFRRFQIVHRIRMSDNAAIQRQLDMLVRANEANVKMSRRLRIETELAKYASKVGDSLMSGFSFRI